MIVIKSFSDKVIGLYKTNLVIEENGDTETKGKTKTSINW